MWFSSDANKHILCLFNAKEEDAGSVYVLLTQLNVLFYFTFENDLLQPLALVQGKLQACDIAVVCLETSVIVYFPIFTLVVVVVGYHHDLS